MLGRKHAMVVAGAETVFVIAITAFDTVLAITAKPGSSYEERQITLAILDFPFFGLVIDSMVCGMIFKVEWKILR